jgi:hypothetical protein
MVVFRSAVITAPVGLSNIKSTLIKEIARDLRFKHFSEVFSQLSKIARFSLELDFVCQKVYLISQLNAIQSLAGLSFYVKGSGSGTKDWD